MVARATEDPAKAGRNSRDGAAIKCAQVYFDTADTPNAYSSIKNKNRSRGLWGPLRGHDVFSERLLLNG